MASVSVSTRASSLRGRSGTLLGALCLRALRLWPLWGMGVLACGPSAADSSAAAHSAQLGLALSGAKLEREYSGALALITVTKQEVGLCTATLLAPNLVATARHCVAPTSTDSVLCSENRGSFSAPYSADTLWLNHSSTLSGPLQSFGLLPVTGGRAEFVPVADVFVPDTEDVCGGDLALLLLRTEFDAGTAAPLAPRLDLPVQRGDPYTAVGFGGTPAASGEGTRRSRTGLEVNCTPEDCDTQGAIEATEFQGGDGVCSGDSGGPALDAEGRVVGIASRSVGCTGSVYSAVVGWRDFIREVATQAASAGSYAAPEWLVAMPLQPVPPRPGPLETGPLETGSAAPDTPATAASPEDSVAPDPTPTPAEEMSAGGDATDAAQRPLASSAAGGGCSVVGSSFERGRQQPLALLLGVSLGALALRHGPRRRRSAEHRA